MKQLLNHVIDAIAAADPDAPCFEIPNSPLTYEAGFRKVNRRQLASALDSVAWWLHRSLGPSRGSGTLAYFGPWDVRYNILLFAAVKAGYKMVFPSPHYSASGALRLLQDLDCEALLATKERPPIVSQVLRLQQYRELEVPTIEHILGDNSARYPYEKTFEQAHNEPLVVLHTSGTTGHPKPVIWTHDWAASFLRLRTWDPPPGYVLQDDLIQGKRLFSFFPPWASGNLFVLLKSIVSAITQVWPISGSPPSARNLICGLKYTSVDAVCVGPAIVEELAQSFEMTNLLSSSVEQLYWAGGGISDFAGKTLASKTTLYQSYGSAESGMAILLRPAGQWDSNEWSIIRFHPRYAIDFRCHTENLFEAVLVRGTNSDDDPTIFKTYPHLEEWSTQDVFSCHPERSGLWSHRGRMDDMIVFIDGENFNPSAFEQHVTGHPEIRAAIMAGTHRSQSSLLIELESETALAETQRNSLVDRVWSTIVEANEACTAQAKIQKSHIIFVSPTKLLPRADKGTVKRAQALQLYREELDSLYASVQS